MARGRLASSPLADLSHDPPAGRLIGHLTAIAVEKYKQWDACGQGKSQAVLHSVSIALHTGSACSTLAGMPRCCAQNSLSTLGHLFNLFVEWALLVPAPLVEVLSLASALQAPEKVVLVVVLILEQEESQFWPTYEIVTIVPVPTALVVWCCGVDHLLSIVRGIFLACAFRCSVILKLGGGQQRREQSRSGRYLHQCCCRGTCSRCICSALSLCTFPFRPFGHLRGCLNAGGDDGQDRQDDIGELHDGCLEVGYWIWAWSERLEVFGLPPMLSFCHAIFIRRTMVSFTMPDCHMDHGRYSYRRGLKLFIAVANELRARSILVSWLNFAHPRSELVATAHMNSLHFARLLRQHYKKKIRAG